MERVITASYHSRDNRWTALTGVFMNALIFRLLALRPLQLAPWRSQSLLRRCLQGLAIAGTSGIASLALIPGAAMPTAAAPRPVPIAKDTYPPIRTQSNAANVALANHLTAIGARMYGAYWCPHCHHQQALFGRAAFAEVDYVECAEEGDNSETERCRAVGVPGFPTWEINGELYPGVRSLEQLAEISGYEGDLSFTN